MEQARQITLDEFAAIVDHLEPIISKLYYAIDELPPDTPILDLTAALLYLSLRVIESIIDETEEEAEEAFSLDYWYALSFNALAERLRESA